MSTETKNYSGLTVVLANARSGHLQPILDALQQVLGSSNADTTGVALAQPRWIDLTPGSDASFDGNRIAIFVEEGSCFYPLADPDAGWGSVVENVGLARVVFTAISASDGVRELLAEAQIRTNPATPEANAVQLGKAAAALIRQGALGRTPRSLAAWPALRKPVPGPWSKMLRVVRRSRQAMDNLLHPQQLQWSIGVLPASAVEMLKAFPWKDVRWLTPPSDGFIADPFLVQESGQFWLFYEQLLFSENRGTLWVANLDPKTGEMTKAAEVLRTEFHLSFPNVFNHNGQWYMLPEQARSGSTTLYRATEFPYHWEKYRDLLPGFPGIDPVLYFDEARWWLFVTHGEHPCNENNLHLFSAESLDELFQPHPENPIRSGLHGSRMAGPLFLRGRQLIRMGQDGRTGYGKGLVLNEISRLDTIAYSEHHLNTWAPEPSEEFGHAFHSFAECNGLLVIDGQMSNPLKKPSVAEIVNRVISKLRH
jgi:hypothetical protein